MLVATSLQLSWSKTLIVRWLPLCYSKKTKFLHEKILVDNYEPIITIQGSFTFRRKDRLEKELMLTGNDYFSHKGSELFNCGREISIQKDTHPYIKSSVYNTRRSRQSSKAQMVYREQWTSGGQYR